MARIIQLYPGKGKMPARPVRVPDELAALKSELKREARKIIQSLILSAIGPNLRKWLTGTQVQRKLNISEATLRKLRNAGAIAYCKIGQDIYFDPVDVDKALRKRKGGKAA